jgi:hypothetical protein
VRKPNKLPKPKCKGRSLVPGESKVELKLMNVVQ